ncbi:hypothetical protein AX15_001884 [Amanita polypyramis BW_CC]|nr:hypothetical protein AX15_001884 [Amanita polypyramis BW_CC]
MEEKSGGATDTAKPKLRDNASRIATRALIDAVPGLEEARSQRVGNRRTSNDVKASPSTDLAMKQEADKNTTGSPTTANHVQSDIVNRNQRKNSGHDEEHSSRRSGKDAISTRGDRKSVAASPTTVGRIQNDITYRDQRDNSNPHHHGEEDTDRKKDRISTGGDRKSAGGSPTMANRVQSDTGSRKQRGNSGPRHHDEEDSRKKNDEDTKNTPGAGGVEKGDSGSPTSANQVQGDVANRIEYNNSNTHKRDEEEGGGNGAADINDTRGDKESASESPTTMDRVHSDIVDRGHHYKSDYRRRDEEDGYRSKHGGRGHNKTRGGNRSYSSGGSYGRHPNNRSSYYHDERTRRETTEISSMLAKQADEIEQLNAELTRVQMAHDQINRLLQERTAELSSAQAFLGKADNISVSEVAKLVEMLNAEIHQASAFIADSLLCRELSKDDKSDQDELNKALNMLKVYLDNHLCRVLARRISGEVTHFDLITSQIILENGLVRACTDIVNNWNPPSLGSHITLKPIYDAMRVSEGQAIAGRWRALAQAYAGTQDGKQAQDENAGFLKSVFLNLLIGIGWSLRGPDATIPPQYEEKIDDIAKKALELHNIIGKGVTSRDLDVYTILSESPFDPAGMDNAYGKGGRDSTSQCPVLCTVDMGLRYKRIVMPGTSGDEQEEAGTVLKPKVVLVSALDGE